MSENGGEPKWGRRDPAADLRLRPERPPVTRLSPKALMGLAAIAAILISGALVWGLYQGQRKPTGGTELYNTENKPTPDGLTTLPRDYSGLPRSNSPPIAPGVPVLGPPLPGDLGRPIHNAQVPAPGSGEPAVDAEQQRVVQETEAARTSRLFATTNARERPAMPTALPPTTSADQTAGPLTGRIEPPPYDPDWPRGLSALLVSSVASPRSSVSPKARRPHPQCRSRCTGIAGGSDLHEIKSHLGQANLGIDKLRFFLRMATTPVGSAPERLREPSQTGTFAAVHDSVDGTLRQFAALQRRVRS